MTLLMFGQGPTSALIITDTLNSTEDREAVSFLSKVYPLPHLSMVITATGTAEVAIRWYRRFIESEAVIARDIEDVNQFAPQQLRAIHAELEAEHGDIGTSTIYHFGFLTGTDQMVRYTYRSVRNYEPERTQHAEMQFATRPPAATFTPDWPETIDDIIALAERIKDENDAGTAPEPVRIGGEMYMVALNPWNLTTTRIHRFIDYDTTAQEILQRLRSRSETGAP